MTQEVTQQQETLQPGSPEHDAAMVAKYDGQNQPEPVPSEPAPTPEPEPLLAGKYKTAADLEKAYKALEARLGAPKEEAAPTPAPTAEKPVDAPVEAPKGIDYSKVGDEVSSTGDITPETRAALKAAGVPDDAINMMVRGVQAQANEVRSQVFEITGGEENFKTMRDWAEVNLSDSEKNFLDAQSKAGLESAKMAVQTLKMRYEASVGRPGNLVQGNKSVSSVGYDSKFQMMQDMRDPQYAKNPAFRAKVEARLAATTAF